MQITENALRKIHYALSNPLIRKMSDEAGVVYLFGGFIADAIYDLNLHVANIFTYKDIDFFKTIDFAKKDMVEVKYIDVLGETDKPLYWRIETNGLTFCIFTQESIKNALGIEINKPDDILQICNFNFEMAYVPSNTKEIHALDDFSFLFDRKLIYKVRNRKIDKYMVNIAIKASKRYKAPFDSKLSKEINIFLKNGKNFLAMKK